MSPLAPHMNGSHAFNHGTSNQQHSLLSPSTGAKYVYSLGDLYGMRHSQSRAPNLGNRDVLALISRQPPVVSNAVFSNFNRHFPPFRHQNYYNGGHMNNGERQRQPNQDRGRANGTNSNIAIRLSIRSDVKLREAENAWKPTFLQNSKILDKDEAAELYRQVRSILNKLTAQNFGILSKQFQSLKIDTKAKLVDVIDLVFNKAVNEPNFSEGYAILSQHLSHCSKQIDSSSTERAYFKRTLINKCQIEFEQHVANKNATEAALAPLMEKLALYEKQNDMNGVNEIKAQIAEEESTLRRRLVSTVRFIGELYKLDMLTMNIMKVCIDMLIREAVTNRANSNQANEKLECLCKLLTTVGSKLERKPVDNSNKAKSQYLDLSSYMSQLKRIADNKFRDFKVSTRIKFMIMDVIALRNNRWVPKTTMATLHEQQMAHF